MKIRELMEQSHQNLSKNGLISIAIMFFCGLICGSVVLIGLLFVDLIILVIPLIVLPTMFAFQRAIIALRTERTLTFSLVFSGYGQYFNPRFSSTYSFWKNLLWLLIVYVGVAMIAMFASNLFFYYTDFMGFTDILNQMLESGVNYEALEAILNEHADFFTIYYMANSLPQLFAVAIMALYFFSTAGHSFFLRMSGVKYPGNYIKDLFLRVIRRNRGEFLKYYFALNWPLFILFIGGLALGGFVGTFFRFEYGSIFTFGLAFAIFISFGLYGSIYFANKEAIYFAMLDKIQKEDAIFKEEVKRTLQRMVNPEEIQELIKELDNGENPENEEEQKNDSEES